MQSKSILCPIDFSDFSAAAYQYALSLAAYYKARIVALHVVELWRYSFADYAACEADYAKFSCILSFDRKQNVEVIVMGAHGRHGSDCLVLGSTTDKVICKAACPVLVVSNPSHRAMGTGPDRRHRWSGILYCADFSNNSERARGYAISLAAEYSAELTFVHVAENAPDLARTEAIIADPTQELAKLASERERKNLNLSSAARFGKTL